MKARLRKSLRRTLRALRRPRIVALVVLAAVAVTGLVLLVRAQQRATRAKDRPAVQRYYDTIEPLAVDGGRILQESVKPRVVDLREGRVTPEQFRREADNWILRYQDLRAQFKAAPRPDRLETAARRYDEALGLYIEAFELFREASRLDTQDARNEAITDAVPTAERADKVYDRARDELKRQMIQVGIAPPATL